jgi:hypothetical protein
MFNDSLAPAEWSFSTYVRPFASGGGGAAADASGINGDQHAVEEVLWAMMVGDAAYSTGTTSGDVAAIDTITAGDSGATNRIGTSDFSTANIATSTDGNGAGATLKASYTASGGAITLILGTETGSGYADDDVLFISKEVVFAALNTGFVTAGSNGTNTLTQAHISADYQANVNGVGTTANRNTFTGFTRDGTDLDINFDSSNKTTLGVADIYFQLGTGQTYKIEECCVNEASLDFDIDGIATIAWSGNGKIITDNDGDVSGTPITEGTTTTSNFIRNRLTSLVMSSTLPGSVTYDMVLTGGNITISNNVTFLTPETLGVVNTPLGHVTGTRSVSGSFTCYLNTDGNSSGALFENLMEGTSTVTNNFDLAFKVGGTTASTPRLELTMTDCHLEIPTHSIDDVISVEANFHALPSTFEGTDELTVKYIGIAI